jgi:hypothetical protein
MMVRKDTVPRNHSATSRYGMPTRGALLYQNWLPGRAQRENGKTGKRKAHGNGTMQDSQGGRNGRRCGGGGLTGSTQFHATEQWQAQSRDPARPHADASRMRTMNRSLMRNQPHANAHLKTVHVAGTRSRDTKQGHGAGTRVHGYRRQEEDEPTRHANMRTRAHT